MSTEKAKKPLATLGSEVFNAFLGLRQTLSNISSKPEATQALHGLPDRDLLEHKIANEHQRFSLFAASLGLRQHGHASLDYRLRDAGVMREHAAGILEEVIDHIESARSILSGERAPFEAQPPSRLVDPHGHSPTRAISHYPPESGMADSSDLDSSSSDETAGSDHELPYRLSALSENIDALYSFAIKIRNPRSRPMRSTKELYKHLPADTRQDIISERESIEINVVRYLLKQEAMRLTDGNGLPLNEETVLEVIAESNWLVSRIGCANARRKQQFIYWREHADRIGAVETVHANLAMRLEGILHGKSSNANVHLTPTLRPGGSQHLSLAHSGATSVTRLNSQVIKNFDTKSVISHQTSVSIIRGKNGEKLAWPSPPKLKEMGNYFQCDFCREFCPRSYANEGSWRNHLTHDLQAYHCTYKDCPDSSRLYGSRREWINHEDQHSRAWRCIKHGEEFETQDNYIAHLDTDHQQEGQELWSDELVAAAVSRSTRPHRDCPLCSTAFESVHYMQDHMAYHLERFAQLALPKTLDMEDEALSDKTGSVHSRRADDRAIVPVIEGSRKNDFDYEEQLTYLDDSASLNDGEASTGGHIALSCEELMRFNSAHVHNDSDTRETGVEKILRWTQETQATNGIPSGRQDVTDAVYRTFLLEPPSIQDETNDGIVDKEDEAVDADEDDEEDEELDFDENDGKLDSGKDDEQLDADDKSKHAIQLEFQGYPPSFTKAGDSWVAYFNQDIPRNLDIELVHDLKDESFVNCVAFSPNGEYLATGSHRMVKIFTVENGKEIASLTDQSFIPVDENVWIMSICYSPDGRFLLTGDQNKTITIWKVETYTVERRLVGHEGAVCGIDISSDGNYIASASLDHTIRTWDFRTGQRRISIKYPYRPWSVAISPDRRLIVGGFSDGSLCMWNFETGDLIDEAIHNDEKNQRRPLPSDDAVFCTSFAPHGRMILSCSGGKTVKIWELAQDDSENGEKERIKFLRTLQVHTDYTLTACFTPDADWVISGSDRTCRIWDAFTGDLLMTLEGHTSNVIFVKHSLTATLFATASEDGRACLWKYTKLGK